MNRITSIEVKDINFILDINEMPFHDLRTTFYKKDEIQVLTLNLEKVLSSIDNGLERFPENFIGNDSYTNELIKFVMDNNKLIPPYIVRVAKDKWTIFDGQHRIGLCRYLCIKEIPFLIRKNNVKHIEELGWISKV